MLRTPALCLALGFGLLLPIAAQAQDSTIRWSAYPADRGKVQLTLAQGGQKNNQDWGAQELQGLDARFPNGPLSFRIPRDAGTLACSGTGRGGRGEGTCRFERDAAYFEGLSRRNVTVTSDIIAWQLALFDVKLTLLDELRRQQYATPSAAQLVAAGIFKVDAAFVQALGAAGYRHKTLEDLIPFRIHNVTPEWIAGWRALGYELTVAQLTSTRIHNVSPDYARAMMAEVRDRPSVDQFIAMRIHGARPGR